MSCNNQINVGAVDPTRSFAAKTCPFSMIGMCFYRCVYFNVIFLEECQVYEKMSATMI